MDRRIRKTRAQLLSAMVHCAERTDWEEISIQQICDAADVSRSTFYLHFQNKAELLDYGFSFLGEEMRRAPRQRTLDKDGALGVLPVLFAFMTERNHSFMFSRRGSSAATYLIARRFHAVVGEMIAEEIAASALYRSVPASTVRFMSAGVFSEFEEWHNEGDKRPTAEVVKELDEVIARILATHKTRPGQSPG